jgi:hypothetical protein
MPKEVRHILFTPDEILGAIVEEASRGRPDGQLGADRFRLDLAVGPTGDPMARIVRPARYGSAALSWEVQPQDLHMLLLRLCRRARVPLPVRAQRRIEVVGKGLCLTLAVGGVVGPPTVMPGGISYMDPELAPLMLRKT